ncbi:hypothetical protein TgHK011_005301 [Trichoderma gracile]|nr:hypothetical protein TgHK011_005301 [Trichoderma gracile]
MCLSMKPGVLVGRTRMCYHRSSMYFFFTTKSLEIDTQSPPVTNTVCILPRVPPGAKIDGFESLRAARKLGVPIGPLFLSRQRVERPRARW